MSTEHIHREMHRGNTSSKFGDIRLNGERIAVGPGFTAIKFAKFLRSRQRYERLLKSPSAEVRLEAAKLYREALLIGTGRM